MVNMGADRTYDRHYIGKDQTDHVEGFYLTLEQELVNWFGRVFLFQKKLGETSDCYQIFFLAV